MNSAVVVENGDDELLGMEHQFEECEKGDLEFPSRSPTPAYGWDLKEPPAKAPSSVNNRCNAPNKEEDLHPFDTTNIQDTTTSNRSFQSATIPH